MIGCMKVKTNELIFYKYFVLWVSFWKSNLKFSFYWIVIIPLFAIPFECMRMWGLCSVTFSAIWWRRQVRVARVIIRMLLILCKCQLMTNWWADEDVWLVTTAWNGLSCLLLVLAQCSYNQQFLTSTPHHLHSHC